MSYMSQQQGDFQGTLADLAHAWRQVEDDWATVIWQKISYLGQIGLRPW